jgi:hypothetical protein
VEVPPDPAHAQGILFGTDPQPLPALEAAPGEAADRVAEPLATYGDARQTDLFAPRATLSRELSLALSAGAFDEASRLRARIDEDYGPCAETRELEFLGRLERALRRGPPAPALETWNEIDRALAPDKALRVQIRDGVFARLLERHAPEAVAKAWPQCLPALTEIVGRADDASEGLRRARRLIRDALLAGRSLDPLDFSHDPAVADLLAEDLAPRWLACLGAVHRLWSANPPDPAREARPEDLGEAPSDDEAALQFWLCLSVADDPVAPDDPRRQARRRMKQLDAELHGRYMRRASPLHGY